MKVRLKRAWRGWKAGHALEVSDGVANLLIERIKVAEILSDGKKSKSDTADRASIGTSDRRRSKRSSGTVAKRQSSRRKVSEDDSTRS
jgi:hypothetical protein